MGYAEFLIGCDVNFAPKLCMKMYEDEYHLHNQHLNATDRQSYITRIVV